MVVLPHLADIEPWVVPMGHLAVVTVPLAVTDVRTLRLPNSLVVPGLVVLAWALVWAALVEPARAVGGVVGGAVLAGVLAVGWMLGAVGMGDVKLSAWLGGTAGMMGVFENPGTVTQGLVAGAVVATAFVAVEPALRPPGAARASSRLLTPATELRIPFGPPLLAAFWVSLIATIAAG